MHQRRSKNSEDEKMRKNDKDTIATEREAAGCSDYIPASFCASGCVPSSCVSESDMDAVGPAPGPYTFYATLTFSFRKLC